MEGMIKILITKSYNFDKIVELIKQSYQLTEQSAINIVSDVINDI